jgi:two-component system chemotaxis sensor kinase CheA
MVCDRLIGEEEVVVRGLGRRLAMVPGYLGAAILGDGRIALLLEPGQLVRGGLREPGAKVLTETIPVTSKLLVVDDSFAVRELQRGILEAAGYRVETAKDGKDALDRLARDREISLVVTDIDMPEMDGLALTEAIRSQPEGAELPVVIVSAQATAEDRRRGLDAGADAYMVKRDFDQQALLETVGRLVGR